MKILIINGSPRKGGNTELLAEAFAKGAAERQRVGDLWLGMRLAYQKMA